MNSPAPSDKATLRGLAIRPKDAKCDPIVSEKKPIVVATTQEQTLLCDRPKEKAVTIVATADRKVDPSSTFNVRVVNSPDHSIYREITDAKVDGHASWISEKIVIKAGANIEIVAKDEKPSLAIAAKTIIVEGPFTVHGKGITGKSGEPQTACAPGGCQWVSGPPQDSSACHNNWMLAGGSPDDKGRPGHPGGKGGKGPIVTFRYGKLQGDSANLTCNLPGGDGGPGGAGGRGRELIDCSNPGSLRKSGPGGDPGPQGPSGESGKCSWIQSVQTTSTQDSVAKAISARRQRLSR